MDENFGSPHVASLRPRRGRHHPFCTLIRFLPGNLYAYTDCVGILWSHFRLRSLRVPCTCGSVYGEIGSPSDFSSRFYSNRGIIFSNQYSIIIFYITFIISQQFSNGHFNISSARTTHNEFLNYRGKIHVRLGIFPPDLVRTIPSFSSISIFRYYFAKAVPKQSSLSVPSRNLYSSDSWWLIP